MSPVDGLYVPFVGINCFTNCSPTRGSDNPTTSVGRYPFPGFTNFTFVTLPPLTVMSAVAPTPDPNLFFNAIPIYVPSLYPEPPANSFS